MVGFVSPVDYTNQVQALDRAFITEYEKGSAARRRYFRDNRDSLIGSYERLAALLANHRAQLQKHFGREAPLVARQEALSMAAYVRQQTAAETKDYAELRDEAMATNVTFLAGHLFPGQKIIIWAHNYHVRYDNAAIPPRQEIFPGVPARSMGSWIRQRFGARVFTLLQYEHSGKVVDNARKPYDIAPPASGLLEERLGRHAAGVFVLDMTQAVRTPEGDWLSQTLGARYNGEWEERLVPTNQADALLFLRSVSPPKFLY
jgi:erythromycin esterase